VDNKGHCANQALLREETASKCTKHIPQRKFYFLGSRANLPTPHLQSQSFPQFWLFYLFAVRLQKNKNTFYHHNLDEKKKKRKVVLAF
jgi:hypothetical protein